eukprot:13784113-Heterocapsa_arctica.AAC.1
MPVVAVASPRRRWWAPISFEYASCVAGSYVYCLASRSCRAASEEPIELRVLERPTKTLMSLCSLAQDRGKSGR